MGNYAIEVLEKELFLIEKCLSEWELHKYREARIEREIKLNELKQELELLKNKE
jgi:hypothetical protein